MFLVVSNFHKINSPRSPSTWLPSSVCPQGWGTVISGCSPLGLGHPISRLPQSMSLLGHFAYKSCFGLPGPCPPWAVHFVLAISCNKQFRLKFSTFLILFPWNGILHSMVRTQWSLFLPFRNEGSRVRSRVHTIHGFKFPAIYFGESP